MCGKTLKDAISLKTVQVVRSIFVLILFAGPSAAQELSDSSAPAGVKPPKTPRDGPSVLLLGPDAIIQGVYEIPVIPMAEFDFKTRQEIHDWRKRCVLEHADLVGAYEPSEAVFGQIAEQRPWWGIYGMYAHNAGERSIDGPSEESRFVLNPYVLVALAEGSALKSEVIPDEGSAFFPTPVRIRWQADTARVTIEYNVSDHFDYMHRHRQPPPKKRKLRLVAYNARDFGLEHLYVDPDQSEGLVWANTNGKAVRIRQWIHRGPSCGYPGGCNNMSPRQPELRMGIQQLPARAHIKLWRSEPAEVDGAADMTVVLDMR